jgi:hypothetical protein
MTRRRLLCGLLLASALLVCFAGWLWVVSHLRVTMGARFEQVKKGMTREEVIRTVGGPPRDYSDGRAWAWRDSRYPFRFEGYQQWLCDEGELLVLFDAAGTAIDVRVQGVARDAGPPTLTERIRRWLGL